MNITPHSQGHMQSQQAVDKEACSEGPCQLEKQELLAAADKGGNARQEDQQLTFCKHDQLVMGGASHGFQTSLRPELVIEYLWDKDEGCWSEKLFASRPCTLVVYANPKP